MKKEDIPILEQSIGSIEEALPKLERAYKDKDYDEFNRIKKFILNLQEKILESLK